MVGTGLLHRFRLGPLDEIGVGEAAGEGVALNKWGRRYRRSAWNLCWRNVIVSMVAVISCPLPMR